MGIMLINVTQALGEMAIMYPVSGGFYTLAVRFIDPAWGFAMVSGPVCFSRTRKSKLIEGVLSHRKRLIRGGTMPCSGWDSCLWNSLPRQ